MMNRPEMEKFIYLWDHTINKRGLIDSYQELKGMTLKKVGGIIETHRAFKAGRTVKQMRSYKRRTYEK